MRSVVVFLLFLFAGAVIAIEPAVRLLQEPVPAVCSPVSGRRRIPKITLAGATTTANPTNSPTANPTNSPTANPTNSPTTNPTNSPTTNPTNSPTANPTNSPTAKPTNSPTANPTNSPTAKPTNSPTANPTNSPTANPTNSPTANPTNSPTANPTNSPTRSPTANPTPGEECIDVDLNFAGLTRGEYVYDKFLSERNVLISGYSPGCHTPDVDGTAEVTWGALRTFDTSNPNLDIPPESCKDNKGDPDLGSPNENCPGGGPGKGAGGGPTATYPNCVAQGMVLIVQESDKRCPDDCGSGGIMRFQFPYGDGVSITSITSLDVDEPSNDKNPPQVETWDNDGNYFSQFFPTNAHDNSLVTVDLNGGAGLTNVREMFFRLDGSGSISTLEYRWCKPPTLEAAWVDMDFEDFNDDSSLEKWDMSGSKTELKSDGGIHDSGALRLRDTDSPRISRMSSKQPYSIKDFDMVKVSFFYETHNTEDSGGAMDTMKIQWKEAATAAQLASANWQTRMEFPVKQEMLPFSVVIDVTDNMKFMSVRFEFESTSNSESIYIDDFKLEGRLA